MNYPKAIAISAIWGSIAVVSIFDTGAAAFVALIAFFPTLFIVLSDQ